METPRNCLEHESGTAQSSPRSTGSYRKGGQSEKAAGKIWGRNSLRDNLATQTTAANRVQDAKIHSASHAEARNQDKTAAERSQNEARSGSDTISSKSDGRYERIKRTPRPSRPRTGKIGQSLHQPTRPHDNRGDQTTGRSRDKW